MRTPRLTCLCLLLLLAGVARAAGAPATAPAEHRYLYVAVPGIRDYLEFGGHGVLVFDVDAGHRFVRRIAAGGLDATGKPVNVKGVCASAATGRLYVSTIKTLACYDLATDAIVWEKTMPGGCDRMSMTPDGKTIYLPSFEGPHWNVVDAATGEVTAKIEPNSGAHNTVVGLDGSRAYLAGLKSPLLQVVDTATNKPVSTVGPFTKPVRPFTVNGSQSLVFACVNDLLGFEVGDVKTGKVLHRVAVDGFKAGPVKRHGCPSHGVGLTPDERELWLCDAHNQRLHVFDATVMPPKLLASLPVREQPGWVTFGLDGRYAYPSTGEVIDVRSRRVVATLADETGAPVHSEKMVEVHVAGGKVIRTGDQFGLGRVRE
jgi:DNA-binding beta-propeller fold protein YncE